MEAAFFFRSLAPVAMLSFVICLVAVFWCALMMSKLRFGKDRLVVVMVGMLSVHHGFNMLSQAGSWMGAPPSSIGPWMTLGATALYLTTVIVLERTTSENRRTHFRLRLAEGNQAPPPMAAAPPLPSPLRNSAARTPQPAESANPGAAAMTEAVIESSPLAMFAVDANGAICFWNSAAEREFGWSKSEVMGRETPFAAELRRRDGSEVRAATWTAPMTVPGVAEAKLTIVASS